MIQEIREKIKETREKLTQVLEKSERDIEKMLKGKAFVFSERAYVSYVFPDKVSGELDNYNEEINDFHLFGYIIQINFEPVLRFQVSYGSYDIESPTCFNPKPQIREVDETLLKEIKDLIEEKIIKQSIDSEDEVSCWETTDVFNKREYYFIDAPTFLKTGFLSVQRKPASVERKVKLCDAWEIIKEKITPRKISKA